MPGRDQISQDEFWESFSRGPAASERRTAERIIAWSEEAELKNEFKQGEQDALFIPRFESPNGSFSFFLVSDSGHVSIQMKYLKKFPPFTDAAKREELRQRLAEFPEFALNAAGMEGVPRIPFSGLADEAARDRLVGALNWVVEQLRTVK